MKRGFTLIELVIVIIILGILATLGLTQYMKIVEKGRIAEARTILGDIRTAQKAYYIEYGAYATDMTNLSVEVTPAGACNTAYYFSYAVSGTTGVATRCTAGGKTPNYTKGYLITLDYDTGVFTGDTAGFY